MRKKYENMCIAVASVESECPILVGSVTEEKIEVSEVTVKDFVEETPFTVNF